jgi:hypothetical protein
MARSHHLSVTREAPKAGASHQSWWCGYAAAIGTPVKAPADGMVVKTGTDPKRGNYVEVDHGGGIISRYFHLQDYKVKEGDHISADQVFARTGRSGNVTGPHLHWSVLKDGTPVDPMKVDFSKVRHVDEAPAGFEDSPQVDNTGSQNVRDYAYDRAIANYASENNLDHVDTGYKFWTEADQHPELVSEINERANNILADDGNRTAPKSAQEAEFDDSMHTAEGQSGTMDFGSKGKHDVNVYSTDGLKQKLEADPAVRRQEMMAAREHFKGMANGEFRTLAPYSAEPDYHRFQYIGDNGKPVTGTYTYGGSGKIENFSITSEGGPRSLGPKGVKKVLAHLQEAHPGMEGIDGFRISGARAKNGKGAEFMGVDNPKVEKAPFEEPSRRSDYLEQEAATKERALAAYRDQMKRMMAADPDFTPEDMIPFSQYHAEWADREAAARAGNEAARQVTAGPEAHSGGGGQEPPKLPPEEPPHGGGGDEPPHEGGGGDGEPPMPESTRTAVEKLTAALREAGPVRKEQEKLYGIERSKRLDKVAETQAKTHGEEGYYAELQHLKGELPHADFESIRDNFTQEDVDSLFEAVKNHPQLSLFDKINARGGLLKLLSPEGGKVPTHSEIELLSRVFPKTMIEALLSNRPLSQRIKSHIASALNVPRAIMASFDLSAPLRQGVFLIGRKEFYKSFATMFKQFGSEKAYRAVQDEIYSRPTYKLMKRAGLALSDAHSAVLSNREEGFMTNWAEKIPLAGKGVQASERAYSGFLNKLRADVFDDFLKQYEAAGNNISQNPKALKDMARFINAATGRGSLGQFNQSVPFLNSVFFSPRLIASRLTMLNPAFYATLDPFVRKQAIKSLLSFAAIATSVLTLAHMGGLSVELDPRSTDFAKIRVGNTRFDVLGGFQQYIRLAAQLITGESKNPNGEVKDLTSGKFGMPTRLNKIEDFVESKFSPVVGFATQLLRGSDQVGNPIDPTSKAAQLFIPLVAQDTYDAWKEHGEAGLLAGIPATFGVGVQTYSSKQHAPKKEGKDEWSFMNDKSSKETSSQGDDWSFLGK